MHVTHANCAIDRHHAPKHPIVVCVELDTCAQLLTYLHTGFLVLCLGNHQHREGPVVGGRVKTLEAKPGVRVVSWVSAACRVVAEKATECVPWPVECSCGCFIAGTGSSCAVVGWRATVFWLHHRPVVDGTT